MPNGRERFFGEEEIIVSKTDLKGSITYANDVFQKISLYTEAELLGQPHNIIRHPDMPACVFKLLWDTIRNGEEIFAYVLNLCKDGAHYWVFAHVTPSYDPRGLHIGYHSNRRVPASDALEKVKPLYKQLLSVERSHESKRAGIDAAHAQITDLLTAQGLTYGQFVFSLSESTQLEFA